METGEYDCMAVDEISNKTIIGVNSSGGFRMKKPRLSVYDKDVAIYQVLIQEVKEIDNWINEINKINLCDDLGQQVYDLFPKDAEIESARNSAATGFLTQAME